MRRKVKRTVLYVCDICHTEHTSQAAAKRCESMPVEEKRYRSGEFVCNIEPRFCDKKQEPYEFTGKVAKIIGPMPFDYEYEAKWLSGRGLNQHVFQYEVSYSCPSCGENKRARYYAPELRKAS